MKKSQTPKDSCEDGLDEQKFCWENHNSSNCYSRVSPLKKKNTKFLKSTFCSGNRKKNLVKQIKNKLQRVHFCEMIEIIGYLCVNFLTVRNVRFCRCFGCKLKEYLFWSSLRFIVSPLDKRLINNYNEEPSFPTH